MAAGRRPRSAHGHGDATHDRAPPGTKAEWTALVTAATTRIAAHLGQSLTLTVEVKIAGFASSKGFWASTGATNADGGTAGEAAQCKITIYPSGNIQSLPTKREIAAHEAWHCFQADLIGLDAYYASTKPPWLIEGSATWVGMAVAEEWTGPGYSSVTGWWKRYLKTPGTRLYQRSYDALGFYGHMAETANDPWTRLEGMLTTSGNEAAFAKAVTINPGVFADTWPSGFVREPDWGAKWNTIGPGIGSATSPAIPLLNLKSGTTATVTVPDRANALRAIDIAAPVVELKLQPGGSAHGVLRDKAGAEYPLEDGTFCTDPAACCPPKQTPSNAIAAGVAILALNGGANPATAKLKGRGKKAADCEPLGPTAVSIVSPTGEYPGTSITTPGECYLSSADPGSDRAWILNLGAFKAAVPEFHGAGGYLFPGQGAGPSAPYAVAFTGGVGPWVTRHWPSPAAGAITVDPGLRSGVVLATLVSSGPPADPVSVSGTWSCGMFTDFWPGFFVG